MASKLDRIKDWRPLFEKAHYRLDELPGIARSSNRNLRRFFKEQRGKTPQEEIDESRYEKAKALLLEGEDGKTIITILGFQSTAHFSRAFKKKSGFTPSAFRRRQRVG